MFGDRAYANGFTIKSIGFRLSAKQSRPSPFEGTVLHAPVAFCDRARIKIKCLKKSDACGVEDAADLCLASKRFRAFGFICRPCELCCMPSRPPASCY